MKKLLCCLGLAMAATLSGCVLYLGEEHNANDCPPGTFPGTDENGFDACIAGGGGGWACETDTECASGCYCDENVGECVEAGYCDPSGDPTTQCGFGFECDCSSSCVPTDSATRTCGTSCFETGCADGQVCNADGVCVPVDPPGCQSDAECAAGQTCDVATGTCVTIPPPGCQSDADCQTGETCDVATGVCTPIDPPPACNGEITCTTPAPTCPAGEVPLVDNGCWIDICVPLQACGVAPSCEVLNTEENCLLSVGCDPVYSGVNCTSPDGSPCSMGQGQCTCESFNFERCETE